MRLIPLLRVAMVCALCAGLIASCRTRRPDEAVPTLIPTSAGMPNANSTSPMPTITLPTPQPAPTQGPAANPETPAQAEAADQALQALGGALSTTDTLDDLANDPGQALLQGLEQLEPTLQSVDTVNDLP